MHPPPPDPIDQRQSRRLSEHPVLQDLWLLLGLPHVRINLNYAATADNDPFFAGVVREFYEESRRFHPRLPLVRRERHGVSVCPLPLTFGEYFELIEASARRNYRKAIRLGYRCERIDINAHQDSIREICRSADVRQGKLPEELLRNGIGLCTDPPTRNPTHDYPWFGILRDDKLVAYAGCLVAGEICSISHILGHAAHQSDGIVPMLIIDIAESMYRNHPQVRYYRYGNFFGASPTMRRFKKKMAFVPYRVDWVLGEMMEDRGSAALPSNDSEPLQVTLEIPANLTFQKVYRQRRVVPLALRRVPGAVYHDVPTVGALLAIGDAARRHFSWPQLIKVAAKLLTPRRAYYCVIADERIVGDGWITYGRCAYYRVEPEDAVIGPAWTHPEYRGRGLATLALSSAINALLQRGHPVTYLDTYKTNAAMEKVIARCGYGPPVALYLRGYEDSPSAD